MKAKILLGVVLFLSVGYVAVDKLSPSDPDEIYMTKKFEKKVKWTKIGETDNYSEYISVENQIINDDDTITFFTLRNYRLKQRHRGIEYRSEIYIEIVDCFDKSQDIEGTYRWAKAFGKGDLVESRMFRNTGFITVKEGSIASKKLESACLSGGYDPESISNI